jgi:hypothetical protein
MKRRVFALLNCFGVLVLATVAQAQDRGSSDPHHYRLTMDKLEETAAATDAIKKMMKADPELKKRIQEEIKWEPPDDSQAKNINSHFPQVAAAIHRNGLTTRDYMLVRITFLIDLYIVKSEKERGLKESPSDNIPPENRALLKKYYDRLPDLGERMFFDNEK